MSFDKEKHADGIKHTEKDVPRPMLRDRLLDYKALIAYTFFILAMINVVLALLQIGFYRNGPGVCIIGSLVLMAGILCYFAAQLILYFLALRRYNTYLRTHRAGLKTASV